MRKYAERSNPLEEAAVAILAKAKRHPVPLEKLSKEIARTFASQKPGAILALLDDLERAGEVIVFRGGREPELFWAGNLNHLKQRLVAVVGAYHTKNPWATRARLSEMRKSFSQTETSNAQRNVDARLFDLAVRACERDGLIAVGEDGVRLPGYAGAKGGDPRVAEMESAVLRYIDGRRFQKLDLSHMPEQLRMELREIRAVLAGLVKAKRLVEIEPNRYAAPEELEPLKGALRSALASRSRLRLPEAVAALGLPRATGVSILEYFDRLGFTRRVGDFRELAPERVERAAVSRR